MSKLDDILYELEDITDVQHIKTREKIKALMLETYQAVRDKTRNEHELDELFTKAVNDL